MIHFISFHLFCFTSVTQSSMTAAIIRIYLILPETRVIGLRLRRR